MLSFCWKCFLFCVFSFVHSILLLSIQFDILNVILGWLFVSSRLDFIHSVCSSIYPYSFQSTMVFGVCWRCVLHTVWYIVGCDCLLCRCKICSLSVYSWTLSSSFPSRFFSCSNQKIYSHSIDADTNDSQCKFAFKMKHRQKKRKPKRFSCSDVNSCWIHNWNVENEGRESMERITFVSQRTIFIRCCNSLRNLAPKYLLDHQTSANV